MVYMASKNKFRGPVENSGGFSYLAIKKIIQELPFRINPAYAGFVANKIKTMDFGKFTRCVEKAAKVEHSERYFMACLRNDTCENKGEPGTGVRSHLTGSQSNYRGKRGLS